MKPSLTFPPESWPCGRYRPRHNCWLVRGIHFVCIAHTNSRDSHSMVSDKHRISIRILLHGGFQARR